MELPSLTNRALMDNDVSKSRIEELDAVFDDQLHEQEKFKTAQHRKTSQLLAPNEEGLEDGGGGGNDGDSKFPLKKDLLQESVVMAIEKYTSTGSKG